MKKASFGQTVKRFMEPALHNKRKLILFSITFFLWKIYEIANVFAFSQIVSSIQTSNQARFSGILVYFLIFILIYQIVNYYQYKFFGFYELDMYRYINEKYLPKLIEIDNNYIESLGSGKVMTIFTKGMDYWSQFTEKLLSRTIGIIVMLGYTAYMITQISWKYFLLLMIVGVVFNLFALKFRNVGLKYRIIMYDMIADYNRKVLRFIMSKHEIMQNNRGEREAASIGKHIGEINKMARIRWPFEHFSYNSMEIGIVLIKIAVMFGVGKMVFGGQASIGEFVGIVALLGYLSSTSQAFIDMIKDYMKNGINLKRFWEFIDTAPRIHNLHIGKSYIHKNGDIKVKNITYAYEKSNVFKNFSLSLRGGTKTAFVGASGSGKTTLIKLIAGYLNPNIGEICIDNNCLSETKLIDYYKKVGYLTQEPSIFDGTVYENLVYALDEKPEIEAVNKVISLSKCEFIFEFENGLETEIGERGVRLSGGQRQRLAIAKIMLKNPDIILLDEPTSALDSFNEEQINIAIHNLFDGKTVIVVAHRLQTVKNADRILVFEEGKIIEEGTHGELIQFGGKYKRMLDLQSGF